MNVYLDIIFLENIIMNSIILFATSLILKKKANYIRILVSSIIGSIYSIIEYIYQLPIYSSLISIVILSLVIVYVAFNPHSLNKMLKNLLIFYLVTFVFGGTALALLNVINSDNILSKITIFKENYIVKIAILGGFIGFIVIIIAFRIVKNKITTKDVLKQIRVKINNVEIETRAMLDTGNLLKEPITNIPVVIIERTLLYDVIPKEILNNLEKILGGDFSLIPELIQNEYISKLKFIPFTSIGKENGMLVGLLAQNLEIIEEDEIRKIDKVIIGIYDKSLTKKGEYRALLGMNVWYSLKMKL